MKKLVKMAYSPNAEPFPGTLFFSYRDFEVEIEALFKKDSKVVSVVVKYYDDSYFEYTFEEDLTENQREAVKALQKLLGISEEMAIKTVKSI
jgi:ABC-type taurine transport system substrate-binding protein